MPRLLLRCAVAVVLIVVGIGAGLAASVPLFARPQTGRAAPPPAFAAVEPIDTHVHAYKADRRTHRSPDAPASARVEHPPIDDRDPFAKRMEPQWSDALAVHRATAGRAAMCTTIDPYGFEDAGFAARVNARLNADFEQGAIAVKLYKTIGMEIKTKAGKYLSARRSGLRPGARQHRGPSARPSSRTSPSRTRVGGRSIPRAPTTATTRSIRRSTPTATRSGRRRWRSSPRAITCCSCTRHLSVVGAHLGSMEVDVDQIAERFDRYPEFRGRHRRPDPST